MNATQAEKQIQELTEKLFRYNREYYQEGGSSIDDNEYDLLMEQLEKLETEFPQFRFSTSPTQRVGGEATDDFDNVAHKHPMLSLANTYSKDELISWVESIQKKLPDEEIAFVCELKIDGLAISILYENGEFRQAITRGNGEVGDDVTANVKTIRSLPLKLQEPLSLEVRGEIYMARPQFEALNRERAKKEEGLLKNPRNAAAGSIRMKDPKTVAERKLDLFLYDVVDGQPENTHDKNLNAIQELNLPITPERKVCRTAEEIFAFCQQWEEKKEGLPFDIDGVVIKVDDLEQRQRIGVRSKSPRWATAWKFKAEKVSSLLLSVENSVGRTGNITPVANLEPVQLLGTEVKRATLHNYEQIERLEIHEGDTLYLEKGGEIIPKIVGVDYTKRKEKATPLQPPTECPVCDTPLNKLEDEVDLRCENQECPAIIEGRLQHFVSKKGMDIQSFGSALIQLFIREKLIRRIPDIYLLKEKKDALICLEGLGQKSVEKLTLAIEESKQKPLNQLIYSFGIRYIGEKAAKTLAQKVVTLEKFMELKEEDLDALPDFGAIMKPAVLNWVQDESNQKLVEELRELGMAPASLEVEQGGQAFEGKKVVITGTLSQPRNDWKKRLEVAGFQIVSAISKKTDYLLCGENAGSKLTKAQNLGIEVLTEEAMEELLSGQVG